MSLFQISARVALRTCRSPISATKVKRRYQASLSSLAAQTATPEPFSGTATPELIWPFTEDLVEGILAGNRTSLSRAITLVESYRLDHRRQADLLLDKVLSARTAAPRPSPSRARKASVTVDIPSNRAAALDRDGRIDGAVRHESASPREGFDAAVEPEPSPKLGLRVGIAGPPGAGKSSFIEVLGKNLTAAGHRVAVITVDPSSMRSGGSILGDKTRMQELSRDPRAFVRGCPAGGVLGGISRYTHEVVLLCQAAGYDPVIVETVGLGQSEVEVEHAVDMLLLMLPPAGGDDLQGSKKGIVEVADAIVVNKADGELRKAACATASDYAAALGLARRKLTCWTPPVLSCSAVRREGIDVVWEQVLEFRRVMEEGGLLETRRRRQAMHWVKRHLQQQLIERADRDPGLKALAASLEPYLAKGRLSPRAAAERLTDCLVKSDSRSR